MSIVGDVHYRGDILSTVGCSVPWGISEYRRRYLEYRWDAQYRGGYRDACGGYHEYRGSVQYRGEYSNSERFSPTCIMISTRY